MSKRTERIRARVKARFVVDNGWMVCAPCGVEADRQRLERPGEEPGWTAWQTTSACFAAEHIKAHDDRGDEVDPGERVRLDKWLEGSL